MSSNNSTNSQSKSRPPLTRSKTLPAIKQALSFHGVENSLASLGASSSKGLRRMSSFYKRKSPSPSTCPTPPMEPAPAFTIPNYAEAPTSSRIPSDTVSPLTRPLFKRAASTPVWTLTTLCESPRRKSSRSSIESVSSVSSTLSTSTSASSSSTSSRRRRSSTSSTTVFIAAEPQPAPVGVRLQVCIYAFCGFFFSLVGMLLLQLFPTVAPENPARKLVLRPMRSYEREIIISEEELLNLPSPPKLRRIKRITRAPNALLPHRASGANFLASTPVDVRTLSAVDVPCFVDSPPDASPLPKGPAPQVRPHTVRAPWRKLKRYAGLPTVKEGEVLRDPALCPGW